MDQSPVDHRAEDRQIWEEELADFVPHRIYDTHIHPFSSDLVSDEHGEKYKYEDADFSTLQAWSKQIYPGRQVHYLVLGCPALGTDVDAHNRMMAEQVGADPLSRMNRLTTPADTPAQIERDVKERGFIGLKPYRIFSVTGDVEGCRIRDFLPERQLEVADDLELWVTMHLARADGCGDSLNLDDLEEYTTRRFSNVRWILAHCGRSFTYWSIRHGVDRLRDMPNIHYDLSAVCDVRPFVTLFQKEDHRRLFFGSERDRLHGVPWQVHGTGPRLERVTHRRPPLRVRGRTPTHSGHLRRAAVHQARGGDRRPDPRPDRGRLLAQRRNRSRRGLASGVTDGRAAPAMPALPL